MDNANIIDIGMNAEPVPEDDLDKNNDTGLEDEQTIEPDGNVVEEDPVPENNTKNNTEEDPVPESPSIGEDPISRFLKNTGATINNNNNTLSQENLNGINMHDGRSTGKPMYSDNTPSKNYIVTNNAFCSVCTDNNDRWFVMLSGFFPNVIDHYAPLIKVLNMLEEKDIIYIDIANVGGSVATGLRIVQAMRQCKGKVVTTINSFGYSMGAMIWSFGDEIVMNHGTLMYHTVSGCIEGKASKMKEKAKLIDDYGQTFLKEVVDRGLLTEEEYNACLHNQTDLWLNSSTMSKRIKAYNSVDNRAMRLKQLNNTEEHFEETEDGVSEQTKRDIDREFRRVKEAREKKLKEAQKKKLKEDNNEL